MFSIDKHDVALMYKGKIVVFSLKEMGNVGEYEVKSELRKGFLLSGMGVLIQSRYFLNFLAFHKGESTVFELKKPGLKGMFNLDLPAPDIVHISQYSLILVTSNDCSFFIDYSLKSYQRYPTIKHSSSPQLISFLHPCYLLSFTQNYLSIYLIYTGEKVHNFQIPSINIDIYYSSYQSFFISSISGLLGFSTPSLDTLIPSLLVKKKFDIALEVCNDTCSSLTQRVYFEYAIFMFFQERDYQRSAHYFRKSEEYWAVCSLLRKIVTLPAFAYEKCEEMLVKACEKIAGYSILQSHVEFISQKQALLYDSALKQRIIHNFIPFFHMARKTEDENLKLFAECWLFSALLYLPNQSGELFVIVRDPSNKLPLKFCEGQLKSFHKLDLLFELFLTRKIYKPPLDLMLQKFSEDKSQYWLIKMKDFLMRVNSNPQLFLEYVQKLFCESPKHAEELLLGYPEILSKVNILDTLVPIMLKFSGKKLVIQFLLNRENRDEANFLAKLYIEETMMGNVNPKELITYLGTRPQKYNPTIVLKYFPKNALQRERCLVLDLLGKYEEILHYYIYQEKNLEAAKEYVKFKLSKDVTSLFIIKICKAPMTEKAQNTLINFLNEANPDIIDHNIVKNI